MQTMPMCFTKTTDMPTTKYFLIVLAAADWVLSALRNKPGGTKSESKKRKAKDEVASLFRRKSNVAPKKCSWKQICVACVP